MSTKILYPPLYPYFFNCLHAAQEDVLLTAPYIKAQMAEKIVAVLKSNGRLQSINLTVITNVNTTTLLSQASDIEALDILASYVPNSSFIGIGNLHAKCYIFDFKTSIITSGNLSPRGMNTNLELGVLIEDEWTSRNLHNELVLKYGNQGTPVTPKKIGEIKDTIDMYMDANAAILSRQEELAKQNTEQIAKYTSNHVTVKTYERIAPELTAIVSTKSRVTSYKASPALLSKHTDIKQTAALTKEVDEAWVKDYTLLLAYREANPRFWPLLTETFNDTKIGLWCDEQRNKYAIGKLSEQKVSLLNEAGFIFSYEEFIWQHRYNLLIDYREEFPNQWPVASEAYQGNALGKWCVEQTAAKNIMSPQHRRLLEKLSFPFNIRSESKKNKKAATEQEEWDRLFEKLAIFYGHHERFPSHEDWTRGYVTDTLYNWAEKQKALLKKNVMPKDRLVKLQNIGFARKLKS